MLKVKFRDYLYFKDEVVQSPIYSHGEGPYHIVISSSICSASQWTSFYDRTPVMKELINKNILIVTAEEQ